MANIIDEFKNAISNRKREMTIKNYYSKTMKNGKSYNAGIMDGILIKLLITFVIFILLKDIIDSMAITIMISLFILIGLFYISNHIKKAKYQIRVEEINEEIGEKRILKDLNSLNNYEFVGYIKKILESYYSEPFKGFIGELDLVGTIKEHDYGVKCIRLSQDERVNKKDVNEFQHSLKESGLSRGILITNSYFSQEVKDELFYNIELIDFKDLLQILKEVEMYPTKEEIEEHILNKQAEKRRKLMNLRDKVFTINKVGKYFFLSFCLFLLSNIATYRKYYLIIALISLLLGLVSILLSIYNVLNMKIKD